MAKKRMFSLQIVDTDAFLEMPLSTQALYFHLAMRADDDGFVDNHKKIMKMIGSAEDDFKVLLTKRFVLGFETGIMVIKHWRINNLIRNDRYTETTYIEQKNRLLIKENGSYTELDCDNKNGIKKIKKPKWLKDRQDALKNSSLPYSFNYKIRQEFNGKICPICNCEMRGYKYSDNKRPTIQHNIPISKGGKHEVENISVICRSCNETISDQETDELNNKEVIDVWNTIGNQMAPQVRLDKVRLGKNNIASISYLKNIPKEDIEELTEKYKVGNKFILDRAEDVIDYCESKGKAYKNYKAALRNFIKMHIRKNPTEIVVKTKTFESGERKVRTPEEQKSIDAKIKKIRDGLSEKMSMK